MKTAAKLDRTSAVESLLDRNPWPLFHFAFVLPEREKVHADSRTAI